MLAASTAGMSNEMVAFVRARELVRRLELIPALDRAIETAPGQGFTVRVRMRSAAVARSRNGCCGSPVAWMCATNPRWPVTRIPRSFKTRAWSSRRTSAHTSAGL